jgi:hypothetical protein
MFKEPFKILVNASKDILVHNDNVIMTKPNIILVRAIE